MAATLQVVPRFMDCSKHYFILISKKAVNHCRVPKPSGLIDVNERQIGKRIRLIRFYNQCSQPGFAEKLGITLNQLAGIEYGRTPLSVRIADLISEKFDVNVEWLSSGRGRMKPCIGLILKKRPDIKPSTPLSKALTPEILKQFKEGNLFGLWAMVAILTGDAALPKGKDGEQIISQIHSFIDETLDGFPHSKKEILLNRIVQTLSKASLDQFFGQLLPPSDAPQQRGKVFDNSSEFRNTSSDMKSALESLLENIRKLTKPTGMKAKLASDLKVPPARVSEWLSGKHEPGGEITLKMIRWCELQEHQTK